MPDPDSRMMERLAVQALERNCHVGRLLDMIKQGLDELHIDGGGKLKVNEATLRAICTVWDETPESIAWHYVAAMLSDAGALEGEKRLLVLEEIANGKRFPKGKSVVSLEAIRAAARQEIDDVALARAKREERKRNKKWWQFWI